MTETKHKTAGPRISTVPMAEVPAIARKRVSKLEPLVTVVTGTPTGRALKIVCDSEREAHKLRKNLYSLMYHRGIRVGLRTEGTTLYAFMRDAKATTKGPQ